MNFRDRIRINFSGSKNNYYSIINFAKEQREKKFKKYCSSFHLLFFEARSLIALGKFDEAEEILDNYISKIVNHNDIGKYYVDPYNDLKAMIHFYKKEYFTFFIEDLPKLHREYLYQDFKKAILPTIIFEQGFMFDYTDKKHFRDITVRHLEKRHNTNFFCSLEDIVDYVMKNMLSIPCYYDNYSQVRIAKIDSIGIYNNQICDYIKIVSSSDNPYTIRTIFPTNDIGEMNYVDLTEGFKDKIISASANNDNNKPNGKTSARSKFILRQSKMNNK